MNVLKTNNKIRDDFQGFTLVELMIVVGIIAIVASIAIPFYSGYMSESKVKSAEVAIEQFPILLETFRAENGSFPPDRTYLYTETNAGVITNDIAGTGVNQAGLADFNPRSPSSPQNQGILYHFSLTINDSGKATEIATFHAIPQTNRGAPAGNVPTPSATYE